MILQAGQIVQFDTPFNILTRPANAFVHDLVGADDMVRQLSLVRVETVMTDVPQDHQQNGEPTVTRYDSLRQALSLLLRTGAPKLTVVDGKAAVGILTLEHIRNSARMGAGTYSQTNSLKA
jgi:osmoprotectant transport system ATP-binding protein